MPDTQERYVLDGVDCGPRLPVNVETAITEFADAAFACGEWTKDDDTQYVELTNAQAAAERTLREAIAKAMGRG